ncbi:MAG TPA: hypothetical protein VGC65_00175 [Bacteroidia bacterium]|jgi:hypothetical protein
MEVQAPQQPFIIQQSGSKLSPGTLLVGTAVLAVGGYFGIKWWNQYVADKEAEKLDTPAAQAASKIYNAKSWKGDDEQVAYDAARLIASQNVPWEDVAKSFKKAGHGNIDEYLDFLSAEEKAQFFNIINLAKPTEPGKPPVASTLRYDDVKNANFVVAKTNTVIRKSPELIGSLSALDILSKSNIVGGAQPGRQLGLMTGKYQLSKDGKTGFIEFWAVLVDGTKVMNLQRVWVAGSNVTIVSFDRKTQVAAKEKYIRDSAPLKIEKSRYIKAST